MNLLMKLLALLPKVPKTLWQGIWCTILQKCTDWNHYIDVFVQSCISFILTVLTTSMYAWIDAVKNWIDIFLYFIFHGKWNDIISKHKITIFGNSDNKKLPSGSDVPHSLVGVNPIIWRLILTHRNMENVILRCILSLMTHSSLFIWVFYFRNLADVRIIHCLQVRYLCLL